VIHNPKVGGSIPPTATNLLLSFQSLTKQRQIAGNAAAFHFAEIDFLGRIAESPFRKP
jgi:hypothetical protein